MADSRALLWQSFLFLLFLTNRGVSAATATFWIERSPEYLTYLGSFAFANKGHVSLNISDFRIYSPESAGKPEPRNIGFFLIRAHDLKSVELDQAKRNTCILYDNSVHVLYNFSQSSNSSNGGASNHSVVERDAPGFGEHVLFLANCENSHIVSATLKVVFFNRFWSKKSYGCSGTELLGTIEFLFSAAYSLLFFAWIRHGIKVWFQTPPTPLHLLLSLVTMSSCLLYLSFGIQSSVIQASGSDHGWDFVSLSVMILHSAALLSLFFIGLERMDPYLSEVERGILYTTVPVLMVSHVILTCLTGPVSHSEWKTCVDTIVFIVNRLAIFAWVLLIGLLFFILLLWAFSNRVGLHHGRTTAMASRATKDDRSPDNLFQKFYVAVALGIIASFSAFKILSNLLPYWLAWVAYLGLDTSFFSLLAYSLYRFRPRSEKSVYELFDEEDSLEELDVSEL